MTVEESAKKIIGKEIIIDTNLLLLLLCGRYDDKKIATFKRTGKYEVHDYNFVNEISKKSKKIIINPGIISELSNLINEKEAMLPGFMKIIKTFLVKINETYIQKDSIIQDPLFEKIGYTDCSIVLFAAANNCWVLTDDKELTKELRINQVRVVNLTEAKREYFYSKIKL